MLAGALMFLWAITGCGHAEGGRRGVAHPWRIAIARACLVAGAVVVLVAPVHALMHVTQLSQL